MIERQGNCLQVSGQIRMGNVHELLAAGRALLADGQCSRVDFSAVAGADSSALAVMLAWLRSCPGQKLRFEQVPAGVLALADMYGLRDLLPLN